VNTQRSRVSSDRFMVNHALSAMQNANRRIIMRLVCTTNILVMLWRSGPVGSSLGRVVRERRLLGRNNSARISSYVCDNWPWAHYNAAIGRRCNSSRGHPSWNAPKLAESAVLKIVRNDSALSADRRFHTGKFYNGKCPEAVLRSHLRRFRQGTLCGQRLALECVI